MTAPPQAAPEQADTDVLVFAYGDDVYVYPVAAAEIAHSVYLVGLAAFCDDGDIYRVSAERWDIHTAPRLRREGIAIKDQRSR